MSERFSVSAARNIFYGGTIFFAVISGVIAREARFVIESVAATLAAAGRVRAATGVYFCGAVLVLLVSMPTATALVSTSLM